MCYLNKGVLIFLDCQKQNNRREIMLPAHSVFSGPSIFFLRCPIATITGMCLSCPAWQCLTCAALILPQAHSMCLNTLQPHENVLTQLSQRTQWLWSSIPVTLLSNTPRFMLRIFFHHISQNYRTGQVGKDHMGPCSPTSLLKQGHSRAHCQGLHPEGS